MQYERLIGLARDAGVGSPCDVWGMPDSASVDAENEKRPAASVEVGALLELQGMTIRDFGRIAAHEGVAATALLQRCERLREQ